MERLTTNKEVSEMNMYELSHNSCYSKDGWTRYRDYEIDIDAKDLARKLLKMYAGWDDTFTNDEAFMEYMDYLLRYGMDNIDGMIAVFYRNMWAMSDLRNRLKQYEDLEEQGKLLKLPCAVGDILYYPYINEDGERKIEELEVADVSAKLYQKQDGVWDSLEEIGEEVFLTRPEAERALEEMEEKK